MPDLSVHDLRALRSRIQTGGRESFAGGVNGHQFKELT
jgi:hypothetical protein